MPAGIVAWPVGANELAPDLYLVDITQLRGDPMTGLRALRSEGHEAPAIVLAAHFPTSRLREIFLLGVRDILLKPYRPEELCEAISRVHSSMVSAGPSRAMARKLDGMREEIKRRSEEVRLLSEIGRVVANLRNLDEILRKVVEAAAFVTEAEEANIYLVEPGTRELTLRASKQAAERHATLQRLRVQDTLVGQVFQTGQPILKQAPLEGGQVKVQTGFLVRSLIKVPLRRGTAIVGVLGVYNRLSDRSFNEHHLALLQALADWAGVALEHSTQPKTPAQPSSPEKPFSSAGPPKSIQGVSPSLLGGLNQLHERVQTLLTGALGTVVPAQKKALEQIRDQLSELRALPVALLHPAEADQFVDVRSILSEVSDALQLEAARQGLALRLENSEPPLPLFRGDSASLYRVLDALTSAAIRRTIGGHVTLSALHMHVDNGRVTGIPTRPPVPLANGPWAVITVMDTSPGLPKEVSQALAEAQVDPSAGVTGPGLSMGEVRMIVESMGGFIWQHSRDTGVAITMAIPFG
jgi:signal transduction histidine kinase